MKRVEQLITQNRDNFKNEDQKKKTLISKQRETQQKFTAAQTWVASLKKSIYEL